MLRSDVSCPRAYERVARVLLYGVADPAYGAPHGEQGHGPAVEELVFRGAVFNGLDRLGALLASRTVGATPEGTSGGPSGRTVFVVSALLSSAFFALLHLEPVLLPAILILAVALCVLFRRTGSLLPPLVAHATFNSFATSLIILNGLGVFQVPV